MARALWAYNLPAPLFLQQAIYNLVREAFNYLIDLKTHLWNKRIKSSDSLKIYIFNEDGILVDEKVLKRIKHYTEEG